jgi:hypothetical protein
MNNRKGAPESRIRTLDSKLILTATGGISNGLWENRLITNDDVLTPPSSRFSIYLSHGNAEAPAEAALELGTPAGHP